ncbi:MAG: universal stress protein [Pseudomonadota bacterium]|nr:universal stress protein [Pseudomonadota bacterium]
MNISSTQQGQILVATDFSEHSSYAVRWALDLADSLRSSILLLHVVHDRAEGPGYYRHDKKDAMRPMEDVAERMLQKFIDDTGRENSHFESFKNLNTEIVTGLPVPKILEVAERINARMIVMGSQGLTGLAHLLIGSKAEQVVRISKIPVTIVKSS